MFGLTPPQYEFLQIPPLFRMGNKVTSTEYSYGCPVKRDLLQLPAFTCKGKTMAAAGKCSFQIVCLFTEVKILSYIITVLKSLG